MQICRALLQALLVLVMGRDGLAGKGRFQSRLAGARLYSEFI